MVVTDCVAVFTLHHDVVRTIRATGVGQHQAADPAGRNVDQRSLQLGAVTHDRTELDTTDVADRVGGRIGRHGVQRSEEHTSELQSIMRSSYAVFCLKKKQRHQYTHHKYMTSVINYK